MAIEWDDLRLVAAIRATGSAAAAARRLGIDQTTAARRLARLEAALGLPLFDRIERRLVARPIVAAAAADLDTAATAVARVEVRFGDARAALTGSVTVATTDVVASLLLMPSLAAFHVAHPGVRLTLDLADRNVSLAAREADVAVRLARPRGDVALTRRIGRLAFGFYAPRGIAEVDRLPLAGYGPGLDGLPESRWLAERFPGEAIAFRADRVGLLVAAVAAGHRALLPRLAGDGDERLVRLDTPREPPVREIWSMVHPERRDDPAVAAVAGWVGRAIAEATRSNG